MHHDPLDGLLARYLEEGDPDHVATLFDALAPRLLPVALRFSRDAGEAEDLIQTTFLVALEDARGHDPARPVLPWLTGILTNQARRRAERGGRRPDVDRLHERVAEDPADDAQREEARSALRRAVAELPERYRAAVELLLSGLGPGEIAESLQRSPGAVRTQLSRAAEMLRRGLPAGIALPLALLACDPELVARAREQVLEAARATNAAKAGGLSLAAVTPWLVGVGLVAGLAAWIGFDAEQATPPVQPALVGFDAAPSAVEPEALPGAPVLATAEREREVVSKHGASSAAAEAQLEAPAVEPRWHDFVLPPYAGYDFARGVVVGRGEAADLRIGRFAGTVEAPEPAALATLDLDVPELDGRPCSGDAVLRSIVRFDPEGVRWRHALDRQGGPYLVRTRGGGYAVAAFLHKRRDAETGETLVVVRAVSVDSPALFVERPAQVVTQGALDYDPTAFEVDPWRAALDQRCADALAELDGYAALENRGPQSRIVALYSRAFAGTIDMTRFAYRAATFSFEHATRDDTSKSRNDWELKFDGGAIDVTMVTDDLSLIYDLGPEGLDGALQLGDGHEQLAVLEGNHYLIHTLDSRTDRHDLIRILRLVEGRALVFDWLPLDPARLDALLAASRDPALEIANGTVRVQMRSGAGNGNPVRAFLHGAKNAYLDELRERPLERLWEPADSGEDSAAWIAGGRIPWGHEWVVESIDYRATAAGTDDGDGEFRVELDGQELVAFDELPDPIAGRWEGELVLTYGAERRSYVEVAGWSQCEVTIMGYLRPAPSGLTR